MEIISRISRPLLALLLDPEKADLAALPLSAEACPDLLFVGGSTGGDTTDFICALRARMRSSGLQIPIVIFPGNAAQFSPEADAILFLSLLSGRNPEWLVGQQIAAARAVHRSGVESIPTAYILIDGGVRTSTMRVSQTEPIPADAVDTIVNTAVAAELMGKQLIYLEAGSGAKMPVSSDIIAAVRREVSVPLIVGGGIHSVEAMRTAIDAGADIIVIGNHFEQHPGQLAEFCREIRNSKRPS